MIEFISKGWGNFPVKPKTITRLIIGIRYSPTPLLSIITRQLRFCLLHEAAA
jgi:hypothetical protein